MSGLPTYVQILLFVAFLHKYTLTKQFFFLFIGQKLLDTLAETWDFFFSDVLPMLQAIFYPVQVIYYFVILESRKTRRSDSAGSLQTE